MHKEALDRFFEDVEIYTRVLCLIDKYADNRGKNTNDDYMEVVYATLGVIPKLKHYHAEYFLEQLDEALHDGHYVPYINLSLIGVYRYSVNPFAFNVNWIPNLVTIIHGDIYADIKKDPLYQGMLGTIFIQSQHVQSTCLVLLSELKKDERYQDDRMKLRMSVLRKLIDKISDDELNVLMSGNDEKLDKWDGFADKYKKKMKSLTEELMDSMYVTFKDAGHLDPLSISICNTAYMLSRIYYVALSVTARALYIKYGVDAKKLAEVLTRLGDQCVLMSSAIDESLGIPLNERKRYDHLLDARRIKDVVVKIRKVLEDDDFWKDLIGE